jgi:hypothetical protein
MLELRYNKKTLEVTGWCADESQFGRLLDRGDEVILILDIPLPALSCEAYLFDKSSSTLKPNPTYIETPAIHFVPGTPGQSSAKRIDHIEEFLQMLYP